jgi:hypothetical protein
MAGEHSAAGEGHSSSHSASETTQSDTSSSAGQLDKLPGAVGSGGAIGSGERLPSRTADSGQDTSRRRTSPQSPQVTRSTGAHGDHRSYQASNAARTHDRASRAADPGAETQESYNVHKVVNTYIERLKPELAEMAQEFGRMSQEDLQWQTEVIISMLPLLYDNRDLAFPFYLEAKDLQDKLIERRNLAADQLQNGVDGDGTIDSVIPIGTIIASGPGASKASWDRVVAIFMSKIDPDILKVLAHLRTVKEWSISGEVSANALFVKGKMGLSITFGDTP